MTRPTGPLWLDEPSTDETQVEDAETDRWTTIFAAIAGGRLPAFDELYDLAATDIYRLALWRTGSPEDAEDVVQDVFVRVAEQGDRLTRVRHPRRWLLTVARRRAIDLVRRRRRRRTEPIEDAPFLEAPSDDPDRGIEAGALSRLIARLSDKQREVLLLRHFADCTFADIGRITGVPTFTAASRHRLAISRLRRLLEVEHDPST
ncbi:MAG: sigma-70 family RNA polymerase sigma factor [Candidatus Sulfomarinibacteraceae bacterium]